MKMSFNSLDKILIEKLMKSQSINIYAHEDIRRFNPIDLIGSLQRLEHAGLAKYLNGILKRSDQFKAACIKHRKAIFHRDMKWRRDVLTEVDPRA